MKFTHRVRDTVLDCDATMEYIRRNFAIEPDDLPTTDHPKAKEALYQIDDAFLSERYRIRPAGSVDGVHYTEYVAPVKQLKIAGRHAAAINLLLKLVDAVASESRAIGDDHGVSPWYYAQLAIIYRKEKRYADEVAILERYAAPPKTAGVAPAKLATRLTRAQTLAAK